MRMKIAFEAVHSKQAQDALNKLVSHYGNAPWHEADVLVCLGGDGFMLETLYRVLKLREDLPVYGLNYGTVGFLMNPPLKFFEHDELYERLNKSEKTAISPLLMKAEKMDGTVQDGLGFNDVYLYRETRQSAHIRIEIDGCIRLEELMCDGVIVATPAGSTAYNRSVHGPIIPLGGNLLSLTPISPFHPRYWRGALLPCDADIVFDVLNGEKRPVSAVAGAHEVRDVARVTVKLKENLCITLLFDSDHALSERIIAEQFST